MPLFLVLIALLIFSSSPTEATTDYTKILQLEMDNEQLKEDIEMYKREVERLYKSVKKFQDVEFERTGLIADGGFLRTGWVSLNNEDCGIYSQDEWACKKPIKGSSLSWGVGCIKDAPKCSSGKAVSTTAGWSRSYKDNKHDKNVRACVQQWIRWECGSNPVEKQREIDSMHMKKHNEWRKKNALNEKEFILQK